MRNSGKKETECEVALERESEEPGRIVERTKTGTEGGRGEMRETRGERD